MEKNSFSEALEVLRNGGVILYPTDTVWGLGCDATNPEAVARIYEIKKRSDSKSLVLLASDLDMVARYIREIPDMAIQLVEVNDKPMTIIYPGALTGQECRGLAHNTVAQDGSVGIRIPVVDFCRDLVHRFGRPIVSTSANISGEPTPRKFADIPQQIKDAVDFIVDPSLERNSTGSASSIIKVGLDGTIDIIRK
ncbi:MAG: threonylcarbamoyl-AMP synthase [Bacteroidetes bacterium]|uniref:L-threonylcarbamoyladenylate synthase n=1 Tax=Candidatus Cryptobacteroides faecigallinarum TaxID=2840763 RepID=A0A9D9IMG3_9BACT|nr:threonylcarbamoyl-AMP synthase [Candidatus Cryptobacteroides faecigallinarum]